MPGIRVRVTRLDSPVFYTQEDPTQDNTIAHHREELASACSKIAMMGSQLETELAVLTLRM